VEDPALREIEAIRNRRYVCSVGRACPVSREHSGSCCVNCPEILADCLRNCEEADRWLICDEPCPYAKEA